MKPEEIDLSTISKMFEYEKHSRVIDTLNIEELRTFAKIYCKMYLRQQEVLSLMTET
jgi:hypothetical protein